MEAEVLLELNNNKCHIITDPELLREIDDEFKFKHPQGFYVRKYMPKGWDGYIHPITKAGYLPAGLFPQLTNLLSENDITFEVEDNRIGISKPQKIVDVVNGTKLRDYQVEAVQLVANSYAGGIYFPRGIINAAMNAGKTLIMISLYLTFKKATTLIILNDGNLFDQFKRELPGVLKPGEYGLIRGKEFSWGKFNVAMAQTLVNRLDSHQRYLEKVDIMLVDECDKSYNKTSQAIMRHVYNAPIRVGLSGTVFKRKLAKDKPKINHLISYFGPELFKITIKELMDMKVSTPVVVKINLGNTRDSRLSDYEEVYKKGIVESDPRNQKILERVRFYLDSGKTNILIVCRHIPHVGILYNLIYKNLYGQRYKGIKVEAVHHETKDRANIIERFRLGKTNVLISSLIIARGQNLPLIQVIIQAAGGDSPETPLQILGRGSRTHESKRKFYFEDFYDMGEYLERHSKHRLSYYKSENLKIIDLTKPKPIKRKRRTTNGKKKK